jgi:glycine cleavage system aminomethyltransferase T
VFDMTPLYRIEVAGPGAAALLDRLVAARTDGPPGSVVYSVMLDAGGGVRSDVTVTRLEEERYWVGGNGPRDLAWIRRHAPRDDTVQVTFIGDRTASIGLWGPRARDIAASLTDEDLRDAAFPFLTARRLTLAGLEVTAVRISYAGELGWELTADAADGPMLWNAVMTAGATHGAVAAGRAALGSLRLEKGYRAWGSDLTPEHGPVESGLGWTLRRDGSPYVGSDAVRERGTSAPRRLACVILQGDQVAMGSEPVFADGRVAGYVTSAAWGASLERSLALAWIDRSVDEGAAIEVGYFDRRLAGLIGPDRPFDPENRRILT